jgi:hypothetical protein
MTRKYAIQLLPLIEAWLKGETIQVKNVMPQLMPGEQGWVDLPDVGTGDEIVFALPLNCYRIKPIEPTCKRNFGKL